MVDDFEPALLVVLALTVAHLREQFGRRPLEERAAAERRHRTPVPARRFGCGDDEQAVELLLEVGQPLGIGALRLRVFQVPQGGVV
jgi:hypothetical protein